MTVPALKAALEERELDATGRKAVLVDRLSEAMANSFLPFGEGSSASGSKKKAESPMEEPPAKKTKGTAKGKAAAKEEAAAPVEEPPAKKPKGTAKGKAAAKEEAAVPVEEPPAKKPKGKAAAKEAAAASAEETANEGKGKAAPAAPAAPSGGGGGRVRQADRGVPGGASLAVHEAYDVKLMQTNIGGGKNNNKFYIIQVLASASEGKFFCWNRWGRLGEEGQNNGLEACASEEAAIKSFSKKFKDKTKNTWVTGAPASAFVKHDGKYQLVEVEDDAGGGEATLGKLSADQIGKGQAVLGLIKAALDGSGGNIAELSSQFYSLIPTQSGRAAPPPIGDMGMLAEKERSLDSNPLCPHPDLLAPTSPSSLHPPHTPRPTPHSQRPPPTHNHPHPSPRAPTQHPRPSALAPRRSTSWTSGCAWGSRTWR